MAVATSAVAITAWVYWHSPSTRASAVAAATAPSPATAGVSAEGRFAPMEPVTRVSAPYIEGHPATIARLAVVEGEHVTAGQLIAVVDGGAQLKAAVEHAEARVTAQEIKLKEVEQSPRPSEVVQHAAEVARWEAAARATQADFERYNSLVRTHDVSASDAEDKRNQMVNAEQMLEAAKARQTALTEHHDEDLRAAQAELAAARAELERARLDSANAEVHAPADGVILHVRARAGEQAGAEGIVEIARTAQMDVMAEVYETDISRVRIGERAHVTSHLLPADTTLEGTVVDIGREVGAAAMPAGDAAAFADTRVVQVRIRLANGTDTANLIGGKATVVLQP